MHHLTPEALEALEAAYWALSREAAPGVDGMKWTQYGEGLEGRLLDLHRRVQTGAYRALPVRRVDIAKPDGGTRPLGVAALEDKRVQKAVVDVVLTPIDEAEFLGFSDGFRPGRGRGGCEVIRVPAVTGSRGWVTARGHPTLTLTDRSSRQARRWP